MFTISSDVGVYVKDLSVYMVNTADDMDKPGVEGAMWCCSPPPRDSAAQGRADADRPLTPTLLSNSVSQEFVAPTQNLKSRVGLRAGSESAPVVRRLGSCFYSSELRTFLFLRVNLGN